MDLPSTRTPLEHWCFGVDLRAGRAAPLFRAAFACRTTSTSSCDVAYSDSQTWSPDELRRFLTSVRNDRLFGLWRLLVASGLRRGEALGLAWDAVELDAGRISIRRALVVVNYELQWSQPKTRRSRRVVAIDATTVAELREHRRHQLEERLVWGPAYRDSGLVFTGEDGSPLHPETVSARFKQLAEGAGLKPIRLHDLRHSYASAALAAGVHAKVVSEQLGHSTVALTLDTYSHVTPPLEEDAASRVAALLDSAR